jgi:hypothetical protein
MLNVQHCDTASNRFLLISLHFFPVADRAQGLREEDESLIFSTRFLKMKLNCVIPSFTYRELEVHAQTCKFSIRTKRTRFFNKNKS